MATDVGEFEPSLRELEPALPLGAIRQDGFLHGLLLGLWIEVVIHDAERRSLLRRPVALGPARIREPARPPFAARLCRSAPATALTRGPRAAAFEIIGRDRPDSTPP